jgi:small subunit ribosomal protein SAe
MTSGYSILQLKEDDVLKILAAQLHIGSKDVDYQMETYVWKKKPKNEGSSVINVRKFWEKLLLAARAIVAVENPADVCAISCQPQGQRAVLKYAKYTGATAIAGRFTPGSFTNQIQAAFKEPRLIIITNPNVDHQAVSEASFVNIPVIAFCDPSTSLRYIDIAIPCNNKANKSIGLMWWFLTREVLRLRGEINRQAPWDVMVDLFFYRDPEETEKEDQTGHTGQDHDAQQRQLDANYYDDGPSIMPASESFAGNQDNWGASATDGWGVTAAAGANAPDTNDWTAPTAVNTTATPGW